MIRYSKVFILPLIFQLASAKITVDSIISNDNTIYGNFSSKIVKNSKGDSVLNVTLNYFEDVLNFKLLITFSIPKDKHDQNYEKVILQSSINACKMFRGVTGDFLSKMIMENMKQYADFDMKCPIKRGQWRITNFIFGYKSLPTYLLRDDIKYLLLCKATIKTPKTRSLVDFFSVKVTGEITKE